MLEALDPLVHIPRIRDGQRRVRTLLSDGRVVQGQIKGSRAGPPPQRRQHAIAARRHGLRPPR